MDSSTGALGCSVRNDMRDWQHYAAPVPVLRDHDLSCLGAGEKGGAFPSFRDRRLGSHALVFISEGAGRYFDRSTGPEGVEVRAPSVIRLFPDRVHGYGPSDAGWTEHWVLFTGTATVAYEELGALDRRRPVVPLHRNPPDLAQQFEELRLAITSIGAASRLIATAGCHRLLAVALREANAPRTDVSELLVALSEAAAEPISIAERGRRLGLGEARLRTLVAETTGMTPHEFIIARRLERAQTLLAETELPVFAIAAAVGYDDAAYFTRLFSTHVGMPPTRFRDHQTRLSPMS